MDNNKSKAVIILQSCNFSYLSSPCLDDISLTLEGGKFYGLIGPNGSGKTTFLNLLAGCSQPDSGLITLYDRPLIEYSKPELARCLSLVPQTFSMEFDYTVSDVVMMGRYPYIKRFSSPSSEDLKQVENALKSLDIYHLRKRYITRLSGGERQRVLVARALAQNTPVMILDEATANLDVKHSIDIMATLAKRVRDSEMTIIAAIHDLDLAASFCDHLIVMQDGALHSEGSVETVLSATLLREVFSVNAEVQHNSDCSVHIRYQYTHANFH